MPTPNGRKCKTNSKSVTRTSNQMRSLSRNVQSRNGKLFIINGLFVMLLACSPFKKKEELSIAVPFGSNGAAIIPNPNGPWPTLDFILLRNKPFRFPPDSGVILTFQGGRRKLSSAVLKIENVTTNKSEYVVVNVGSRVEAFSSADGTKAILKSVSDKQALVSISVPGIEW